jgi:hypothetical protein
MLMIFSTMGDFDCPTTENNLKHSKCFVHWWPMMLTFLNNLFFKKTTRLDDKEI